MMDVAKTETFRNFTILNKAFVILIKNQIVTRKKYIYFHIYFLASINWKWKIFGNSLQAMCEEFLQHVLKTMLIITCGYLNLT